MSKVVVICGICLLQLLNVLLVSAKRPVKGISLTKAILPLITASLTTYSLIWLISQNLIYLALIPLLIYSYQISLSDAITKKIPNKLNAEFAISQTTTLTLYAVLSGEPRHLLSIVFGILYLLLFLILNWFSKQQIGMGDVKLAFPIGVATSMVATQALLISFGVSFSLAAAAVLILMSMGKIKLGDRIPFAPFMFMGAALSILMAPA